jgi:hypothetical protein
MKHIRKFNETKKSKTETEKDQEVLFNAKNLIDDKEPSIKTQTEEDNEKTQKEFKKSMDKIEKFEAFIDVHIDNIENVDVEYDFEDDEDSELDAHYEEDHGCGCCDNCNGQPGCDCGCDDCQCGEVDVQVIPASQFISNDISEGLKYHLDNNKPVTENIYRPGSEAFYEVIKEARKLFERGSINLCDIDRDLFESTEIGSFAYFNGQLVPLDLPMENIIELNEAEYKGKKVKLNYPMRSSGPKKYKVYVKNPKTGKITKVNFGDVKGGLTAKISDPKARKAFSQRHGCSTKHKDKTKAGYWSCRLTKFGHLFGKRTYPGFW